MTQPAASRPLGKVVTVNTADVGGGAERIAWTCFQGYRRHGLESWLVVGDKKSSDPHVLPFFLSPHIDYRPHAGWRSRLLLALLKRLDRIVGLEDFRHPYSRYLPEITGSRPDVIHLHNLHGGFFDLRVLPRLSRQIPVCLTLHDSWCLTGHCAYPFGCTRWRSGCGACPHLDTPPALPRDGTRWNWLRKRHIFRRACLRVATSSNWLLRRAQQSVLGPAILESRIIPCGIDLGAFRPGPRREARHVLGIPPDVHLLLFVAHQARSSPFKDYPTLRAAAARLAGAIADREVHLYCVGESAPDERAGRALVRHVPFEASPPRLARYYQAADVYLHAARAEAFGMVIAEALACGLPVVATDVDGIAEVFADQREGFLVPPGDPVPLAEAAAKLLREPGLAAAMGQKGVERARKQNDQEAMVAVYIEWFREVLERQGASAPAA